MYFAWICFKPDTRNVLGGARFAHSELTFLRARGSSSSKNTMAKLCPSRWVAARAFFLLSLWTSSAAPQQRPREAVLSAGSVQPRQRLRRENAGWRGRRLISQDDDAAAEEATNRDSPGRPQVGGVPVTDRRFDHPMASPPSPLFELGPTPESPITPNATTPNATAPVDRHRGQEAAGLEDQRRDRAPAPEG